MHSLGSHSIKRLLWTVLVTLSTLASCNAMADDLSVLKGQCMSGSHVAEGAIGEDLTKHQSRFFCDSAIISIFSDNLKHVLVQFTNSKSHHSPLIGYAGMIRDRAILDVRSVYLEGGKATPVAEGYCKFFFKETSMEKNISGLACGAKIDEGDRRTVPIVVFETDPSIISIPPHPSSGGPNLPPYNKNMTGDGRPSTPISCDVRFLRANAIFIRASTYCSKDYIDSPAGNYALAMVRQCVPMGEDKVKSLSMSAMQELDAVARQRGKSGACRWVDEIERDVAHAVKP